MNLGSAFKWNVIEPVRSSVLAVRRKAASRAGKPVVSRTCQIADIQLLVEKYCGGASGQFVEVGAFDGERFSNTSWLADKGWRGLYIEASPVFARLCRIRHMFNDVTVENVAAGEENGQAVFTEIGALSSLSSATLNAYDSISWAKSILKRGKSRRQIRIRPLNDILASQNVQPEFKLLVVDVEGYEEQVFSGFSIGKWKPKLVIVELCDVHPDFQNQTGLVDSARRVRRLLLDNGYESVWQDNINSVFHHV